MQVCCSQNSVTSEMKSNKRQHGIRSWSSVNLHALKRCKVTQKHCMQPQNTTSVQLWQHACNMAVCSTPREKPSVMQLPSGATEVFSCAYLHALLLFSCVRYPWYADQHARLHDAPGSTLLEGAVDRRSRLIAVPLQLVLWALREVSPLWLHPPLLLLPLL